VTIRQLVDAYQAHPDAEFRIDDVEVEHVSVVTPKEETISYSSGLIRKVTFVGNITNYSHTATSISSTIEDGTGSIDVRLWVEAVEDDTGRFAGIEYAVSDFHPLYAKTLAEFFS
jgi:replication factor A2